MTTLFALALGAAPAGGAPLSVLVLDLRVVGDAPPEAAALGPEIAEQIARSPELKVVTQEELKALLEHSQDLQLTGCAADEACVAEVARASRAERFVTGIDSPVTIDSSTVDRPSSTTASTGTFSPGRTRSRSPMWTSSSATS